MLGVIAAQMRLAVCWKRGATCTESGARLALWHRFFSFGRRLTEAGTRRLSAKALYELMNGIANEVWGVLLDEVNTRHRDFALVRPYQAPASRSIHHWGNRARITDSMTLSAPKATDVPTSRSTMPNARRPPSPARRRRSR